MNIYVGNLNFRSSSEGVTKLFERFGTVNSARIVKDRETGRSKGFGFVEMDDADGASAISALNESEFDGRTIRVNEARERD